ncbi:dihydroxyacetone kinase subunit DhaK [Staphylococcus auricularis]|uniref:Dihydroxyacetone kinase subunit DhaK n=1 Tax=Staphylococcus auricularis TaxID=29379 RepID=A0ABX5IDM9_9STAP|nr:dihydroxyacetone kinase subunit DhaK [Staphylococcus auricularis]PTH17644.1 dihydroxyacetone kinase subunit DhaK [Staphylococcus auricularis]
MKKLIKAREQMIQDMLAGLDIQDDTVTVIEDTVVVRAQQKQTGVAIVSGGGSGHEPAHAGYVAEGMLDAAVCGEIFTSPTPDKILSAIKSVNTGDGVLLIVKNYAGDVMNFEMAQEMAEMEDIPVEMVVARDDVAVSNVEQRRGVAGTVLVHKYAGYLAEQGQSLSEIKDQVTAFNEGIKSIGMALTAPYVPTTEQYGFDIAEDEMELGIGIHGERGISKEPMQTVDEVVQRLLDTVLKEVDAKQVVVMVNGMGGTPLSELNIVTKYTAELLDQYEIKVQYWFVGDYMTSLDMQGVSLTLAPVTDDQLTALTARSESQYFK